MAHAETLTKDGKQFLFEKLFGKCWPKVGDFSVEFPWQKGQPLFDAASKVLTDVLTSSNNKKANDIFKIACVDTSNSIANKADRTVCVERLALIAAMLNACKSSFSSKCTTETLKAGSSFTDGDDPLRNVTQIWKDVRERMDEITAIQLNEQSEAAEATC
jgi:hypothetical protein